MTTKVFYETRGMNHTEGGWPKDVNHEDTEQTMRFRKKIEKDDMYIHSVHQLSHTMEHCILQNNAINIYEEYFKTIEENSIREQYTCKTLNIFREPSKNKRPIQQISWSPDGGTHLAAAYSNLNFQHTSIYDRKSYIWNINNPSKPEITLDCGIPIVSLEYNPKDMHTLISGLFSGQLAFWDIRKGYDPVELSPPENSHKDPVLSAIWTNSKSGTELFSSSPDGQIKWWDVRKLSEPLETIVTDLTKGENPKLSRAHGISVLEYEPSIPIRFMIGTETGYVISGNRKGKTPLEKLPVQYRAHYGPICALQRNPAFVKIFLTVGDWCAKIWSEDCKESAILWTNYHKTRLTSGAWNPSRYSIFYTTTTNGILDVWDVLNYQPEPNMSIKVCDQSLICIRCHESGKKVATADSHGNIYLHEFSENLAVPSKNDKSLLTAMFERECRREKIIESKMKELRLKSRVGKVIDTNMIAKDMKTATSNLDTINIQAAENEFLSIIEEENTVRKSSNKNNVTSYTTEDSII